MAKVIIFGLMDLAELAHYYLTEDSEHEVVAFTVHKKYKTVENFKGLPVVDFETIEEKFPNTIYHLFAPMIGKQNETGFVKRFIMKESKKAINSSVILVVKQLFLIMKLEITALFWRTLLFSRLSILEII